MKDFLKKHLSSWGAILNQKTVKLAAIGVGVLIAVNSIWLSGAAADRVSYGVIAFVVALIIKGATDNLATKGEASHG